jgi:transposase
VPEQGVLPMTQRDRDRLVVLKKAQKKLITQSQAAKELDVSERHVRRLLVRLREGGDRSVIHGLRGRESNRKLSAETREKAIRILSGEVYRGFGPTLAREYLAKKHKLVIGRESLRQLMKQAGLWRSRKQQIEVIHEWRPRRSSRGEMVLTTDEDPWSVLSWIRCSVRLRLWPIPASTTGWKAAASACT